LSSEKDRIEVRQLSLGDVVTKVREVSDRLVEDNVSQSLTRIASRLDEYAHAASHDLWRSELAFMAMVIGVTGSSLGRELKEASVSRKQAVVGSLKQSLSKISQSLSTKEWSNVHTALRDLYYVGHEVELA